MGDGFDRRPKMAAPGFRICRAVASSNLQVQFVGGSRFCNLGGGFYTDRPPYKATALRLVSAEAGYRNLQISPTTTTAFYQMLPPCQPRLGTEQGTRQSERIRPFDRLKSYLRVTTGYCTADPKTRGCHFRSSVETVVVTTT